MSAIQPSRRFPSLWKGMWLQMQAQNRADELTLTFFI